MTKQKNAELEARIRQTMAEWERSAVAAAEAHALALAFLRAKAASEQAGISKPPETASASTSDSLGPKESKL